MEITSSSIILSKISRLCTSAVIKEIIICLVSLGISDLMSSVS